MNTITDEEIYHLCITAFPNNHRLNNEQWNTLLEGFDKGYKAALQKKEDKPIDKVSDAVEFAEWVELEGYRIKGMDNAQRQVIYEQFKSKSA